MWKHRKSYLDERAGGAQGAEVWVLVIHSQHLEVRTGHSLTQAGHLVADSCHLEISADLVADHLISTGLVWGAQGAEVLVLVIHSQHSEVRTGHSLTQAGHLVADSCHLEISADLVADHLISTGLVVNKPGHVGSDSGYVVEHIGLLVGDFGHPEVHVVEGETQTGL